MTFGRWFKGNFIILYDLHMVISERFATILIKISKRREAIPGAVSIQLEKGGKSMHKGFRRIGAVLMVCVILAGCSNVKAGAVSTGEADAAKNTLSSEGNTTTHENSAFTESTSNAPLNEEINSVDTAETVFVTASASDVERQAALEALAERNGEMRAQIQTAISEEGGLSALIDGSRVSQIPEESLNEINANRAEIRALASDSAVMAKSIAAALNADLEDGLALTPAQIIQMEKLIASYESLIEAMTESLNARVQEGLHLADKKEMTSTIDDYIAMQAAQIKLLEDVNTFLQETMYILDIERETTPVAGTSSTDFKLVNPIRKVRVGADYYLEGVEPISVLTGPNDPGFIYQWGLVKTHMTEAWSILDTGEAAVKIAIVDTGIDGNHEDLAGRVNMTKGYDFVNDDSDATDDNGHGTHVAGIIGATANNGVGIAGVVGTMPVELIPVKVLGSDGAGSLNNVVRGIDWAIDQSVDIINLSVGAYGDYPELDSVLKKAYDAGIVVITAAGNDGVSCDDSTLTASNETLTVAAVGLMDRAASFSNYGESIDVAAPGKKIISTVPGNQYEAWDGTSMATPMVTGLAAMLIYEDPGLTADEIFNMIKTTTEDLMDAGDDIHTGSGLINGYAAVEKAAE
jgi:subtilisin family serine protease